MKLWEVLKALEENPKKKFTSNGDIVAQIYEQSKCYGIIGVNPGEVIIDSERDWQEVKQPVPWHKAIEEWAKGKNISCEVDGFVFFYSKDSKFGEDKWRVLKSEEGEEISVNEILNGKWHVEED